MSVGGSLGATTEYVIGTFGGAIYAGALGALLPHATALELASVLAFTVAPLAYAAALNPSFRVAPFTGVIVLLISSSAGRRRNRIGTLSFPGGRTRRRGRDRRLAARAS